MEAWISNLFSFNLISNKYLGVKRAVCSFIQFEGHLITLCYLKELALYAICRFLSTTQQDRWNPDQYIANTLESMLIPLNSKAIGIASAIVSRLLTMLLQSIFPSGTLAPLFRWPRSRKDRLRFRFWQHCSGDKAGAEFHWISRVILLS